jgi:hypothetical protein
VPLLPAYGLLMACADRQLPQLARATYDLLSRPEPALGPGPPSLIENLGGRDHLICDQLVELLRANGRKLL